MSHFRQHYKHFLLLKRTLKRNLVCIRFSKWEPLSNLVKNVSVTSPRFLLLMFANESVKDILRLIRSFSFFLYTNVLNYPKDRNNMDWYMYLDCSALNDIQLICQFTNKTTCTSAVISLTTATFSVLKVSFALPFPLQIICYVTKPLNIFIRSLTIARSGLGRLLNAADYLRAGNVGFSPHK